jgi:hypothetical protein
MLRRERTACTPLAHSDLPRLRHRPYAWQPPATGVQRETARSDRLEGARCQWAGGADHGFGVHGSSSYLIAVAAIERIDAGALSARRAG